MDPLASPAVATSDRNGVDASKARIQSPDKQDGNTSSSSDRKRIALQQADDVLEAVGGLPHLDGFNLLGVIANPRGTAASLMSTSFHGRYTPTAGTAETDATVSDVFTDAYNSFETTLTSVTEQMEMMNLVLEDWSRQILEDDTDAHAEGIPDSQLRELPQEMQNLNLQSLQNYLEKSGVAAHAFQQILLRKKHEDKPFQDGLGLPTLNEEVSDDVSLSSVVEIPEVFFQEEFDLGNPETFRQLLIASEGEATSAAASDIQDDVPVSDWFPLVPPESFGASLDKVEIALLNQVRSKSAAFFEESLRFAKLQQWIETLLTEVESLQTTTQYLREDLLDPLETVPSADQKRQDLRALLRILDRTDELISSKSTLSGILAAQDDLAAIEQITYSRKLLAGDALDSDGPHERSSSGLKSGGDFQYPLNRVQALKQVTDQLNQYESLVVSNLREELVEIFLGWNTAAVSSVYGQKGSNGKSSSNHVQDRVREIVAALKNCDGGLTKSRSAYSKRLEEMIRMTIRTTVSEFAADSAKGEDVSGAPSSLGATSMNFQSFQSCLDMLFEQLTGLLKSASGVDTFCTQERFFDSTDETDTRDAETTAQDSESRSSSVTPMGEVVASAAELSAKSISELLRGRKEAHSLLSLDEMKTMWDACTQFTVAIENMNGQGAALRSTLLAQAKAFVDRKHESNMSALVAALDSERWSQCEVSNERQEALTRLCTGRSIITSGRTINGTTPVSTEVSTKNPEAEVEGTRYKVVWSCLLLMEMVTTNIAAAIHFSSLTAGLVGKVCELLRLFNSRSTHLVLGAGAINSNAKLKSINARHLSLVTQCLGMIMGLLPHVRAAFMAHMPKKQHTLLNDIDQIKKEFAEHNEKVLNKFVTIIGGIVEHGLVPKIAGTDFDARGLEPITSPLSCCIFIEGVSSNTKKMHQVLKVLLPPDHLRDVFSRIFAYVDTKIPALLTSSAEGEGVEFSFPSTDDGRRRLLLEIKTMTEALNSLDGVLPWEFTAVRALSRQMDYDLEEDCGGAAQDVNGVKETKDDDGVVTADEPESAS